MKFSVSVAGLTLACVTLQPVSASAESMDVAMQLGSILAAESVCGLTFDQGAIRAYIEKKVKADDMQFPSMLQLMTKGSEVQDQDLAPSAKAALCAQTVRVARSYGFTK